MSGTVWRPTKYKVNKVTNTFGDGLNTYNSPFDIGDGEMTYCHHVMDDNYPAVRTMCDDLTFSTEPSTNVQGLGQRNDEQLHMVLDNTWKYYPASTPSSAGTVITTSLSTDSRAEFDEFVTGTNRYTIMMNSTQKLAWDGTSTCAALGDASTPVTRLFAVNSGRIFAVTNNEIKFCALNLINDWTTVNDAGSISVTNAKGPITAICSHNDRIIVFTANSMHFLYGSGPGDFELVDSESYVGCVSQRSILKHKGFLYWAANDGIYQMESVIPVRISDAVGALWAATTTLGKNNSIGGSKDDIIVIFTKGGGTTFFYNTNIKKWYTNRSQSPYGDCAKIGTKLLCNQSGSVSYFLGSTSRSASWSFETKAYHDDSISGKKSLAKLHLIAQGFSTSANVWVGYSSNVYGGHVSSDFTYLAGSTAPNIITLTTQPAHYIINTPPCVFANVDYYRLMVSGSNDVKVFGIEKEYRIREG